MTTYIESLGTSFDGATWLVSGAAAYCHLSSDEHHHHKKSIWEDATFYEQLVASNVHARIGFGFIIVHSPDTWRLCSPHQARDSRADIIYRQQRAGFGGRPSTIFKLRTMTHNHDGGDCTRTGDERVTRVGRFLRHYRIDELPQIINILRGEMSWIGPRPEANVACALV